MAVLSPASAPLSLVRMPSKVRSVLCLSMSIVSPRTDKAVIAALKRVPAIKPSHVDEVFFGNVLSAKSVQRAMMMMM